MESIITKGLQKNIAINKIRKNPLNSYNAEELDDLRNSIITNGLITPISVIGPFDDDEYMLIAGERRLNIFKDLFENGQQEYCQLPAYIVGDANMGETEQQLLIEASNLDTRDGYDKQAHYLRVVKLIKQYGVEKGLSCHEYSRLRQQYMKCSPRYARFYEQVFEDGTEALQEMVENGEVSVSRAGRLAHMPDYIQESAITDLKAGMSQDEVVKKYAQIQNELKKEQDKIQDPKTSTDMEKPIITGNDTCKDIVLDEVIHTEESPCDEDFEDELEDIDFNSLDTGFLDYDTITDISPKSKTYSDEELHTVIHWCNKMLGKKNPTDEEWEAIEACRKVVNIF